MSSDRGFEIELSNGSHRARLSGELDMDSYDELATSLGPAFDADGDLELDLADVTFVDSNVRAVALAEINAQSAGLTDFKAVAAIRAEGLADGSFDVVMTNPPYYGQTAIAQMFVQRAKELLKSGGRVYLVTKQFEQIEPIVRATFGEPDLYESRGYIILVAAKP